MTDKSFGIELDGGKTVTAVRTPASGGGGARWTFVYAPGAGSNVNDPFGAYVARELAGRGVEVVRFQFPYMEAGKRAPDRNDVLETTWRAVVDHVRSGKGRSRVKLVAGGRSMGGRMASQVAAEGVALDGLALFAYPLHPPGKPEQRRDAHLASIDAPVLFCSGTNDAFASASELQAIAAKMRRASVHMLEGADHGFAARKASGRTREDVWAEAVGAFAGWWMEVGG